MITVQYKAPQILKCCSFSLITQKFKTCIHSSLYPSQMSVHYWYCPPAKTTAFFYWQSYFKWQKMVFSTWENQYLMLPQCGLLSLLIFSASNWLKYEVLLAYYISVCLVFFLQKIKLHIVLTLLSNLIRLHVWVSVHHNSILYKEPTRCNFGSIVY